MPGSGYEVRPTTSRPISITDGPSKLDLMLALFDKPHGKDRVVTFKSPGNNLAMAIIVRVEVDTVDVPATQLTRDAYKILAVVGGKFLDIRYRTDLRQGVILDRYR